MESFLGPCSPSGILSPICECLLAWEISAAGNSIHLELLKEERKAHEQTVSGEAWRSRLSCTSRAQSHVSDGSMDSSPAAFDRTIGVGAVCHSLWLASESRVLISVSDWQNHMPETGIEGSWGNVLRRFCFGNMGRTLWDLNMDPATRFCKDAVHRHCSC